MKRVFFIVALLLLVVGLVYLKNGYEKQQIQKWATEHNYSILSVEEQIFDKGPYVWRSSKHHDFFKVSVKDDQDKNRNFFICIGSMTGFEAQEVE